MDPNVKAVEKKEPELCHWWALNDCRRGAACTRLHPEQLDPGLVERREHDYMVPNEIGVACHRCLSSGLQVSLFHHDRFQELKWHNATRKDVVGKTILVQSVAGLVDRLPDVSSWQRQAGTIRPGPG